MSGKGSKARIRELTRLIEYYTPEIKNAFLSSIQDVKDTVVLDRLIEAIKMGDPIAAFEALGLTTAALRPITQMVERAFEAGGVMTGKTFPDYVRTPSGLAVFRFDVRNARSEAFLRDQVTKLTGEITEKTRQTVAQVLVDGMSQGVNSRSVALNIVGRIDNVTGKRTGGVLGLAPNQYGWVKSVREELENLNSSYLTKELRDKRFDRMIEKAIKTGENLSDDQIDGIVNHYTNNVLRYRGETIGRTEANDSLAASEREAIQQAIDIGAVRENDILKIWDDSGDNRTREDHKEMGRIYAKGIPFKQPFRTPNGEYAMMQPLDASLGAPAEQIINCRCKARYEIDFLAQWNDE